MFTEAEVDEHRAHIAVAVGSQHNVGRLDVEMRKPARMKIGYSVDNREYQAADFVLAKRTVPLYVGIEAFAFEIFHHIICRTVDFENLVDLDYIAMSGAIFGQPSGFGDKVPETSRHQRSGSIGARAHNGVRITGTLALVADEMLFYGDMGFHVEIAHTHGHRRQICDAEATGAKNALYAVGGGALQHRSRAQRLVFVVHCRYVIDKVMRCTKLCK